MEFPNVCVGLGQLHAVEVPELGDSLQLVQKPEHGVQAQLRGLGTYLVDWIKPTSKNPNVKLKPL